MPQLNLINGGVLLFSERDRNFAESRFWFATTQGYAAAYGEHKTISFHRHIMKAMRGMQVDHKNRNRLDNRRSNLRLVTPSQNQMNAFKNGNKTSRFKGVCRSGKTTYKARIAINGRTLHLGSFKSEVKAAKRYDQEAVKLFGKFARLNFPI